VSTQAYHYNWNIKVLHFKLFNNNNQYRLIFQSLPYQHLTSPIVYTRVRTVELARVWYMSTRIRTKERPNITRS